jgi:hypothetical protein
VTETRLVSGGFYVARIVSRPPGMINALLPERLLTLSSCLTDFFPDAWAIEWASYSEADRIAAAAKVGVRANDLSALIRFATGALDDGRLGWPCVWQSSSAALTAVTKFGCSPAEFAILELGIPVDIVEELLRELAPKPCEGEHGLYTRLRMGEPLDAAATPVGWELLGVEHGGEFHSWLCNSLQDALAAATGAKPGPFGLLATENDARTLDALIANGLGAEPVPWFPGLISRLEWSADLIERDPC